MRNIHIFADDIVTSTWWCRCAAWGRGCVHTIAYAIIARNPYHRFDCHFTHWSLRPTMTCMFRQMWWNCSDLRDIANTTLVVVEIFAKKAAIRYITMSSPSVSMHKYAFLMPELTGMCSRPTHPLTRSLFLCFYNSYFPSCFLLLCSLFPCSWSKICSLELSSASKFAAVLKRKVVLILAFSFFILTIERRINTLVKRKYFSPPGVHLAIRYPCKAWSTISFVNDILFEQEFQLSIQLLVSMNKAWFEESCHLCRL